MRQKIFNYLKPS